MGRLASGFFPADGFKKIPRRIESLTIVNPYLEKQSKGDKLSILDVRAQLDDGTAILVEMHLYDMGELKYKTIRSWARAYSEEIKSGESYSTQPPVVCVTFANGSIDEGEGGKIHKCCKIMDIDDSTIFTDALELHYIDMKAFVKTINERGNIGHGETYDSMLAKWLTLITAQDIEDKTIIKNICEDEEEIEMAVSTLVRLSEDKLTRQEYLRWQDDIMLAEKRANDYKLMERRSEQDRRRTEQEQRRAEQEQRRAEKAEAENEKLRAKLAELGIRQVDS
ncbi:MAG: Rpn family recombination-promoting nuclease/putative transposase [Clostridiales bacterium]|jgi:predicted transposase/invertase (TIGR01784 family)|nr:Rpn family recombination-promoting nuclease/putative transposase [Clostridiales bacterium]